MSANNRFITSAESLVTTHEETRNGFLHIALEKNQLCGFYIQNASAFKDAAAHTKTPQDLLSIPELRPFLVTAAGISDKALSYLDTAGQTLAIQELIEKFLKPAGSAYLDEAAFRYLLMKGDAMGGTMRNRIGALGQETLIRAIYSSMSIRGLSCRVLPVNSQRWHSASLSAPGTEHGVKALHWTARSGDRLLIFNAKIPTVNKNVDLSLFSGDPGSYNRGRIVRQDARAIMFGELKGSIDPAGADEHWKTGNSALTRIRTSFAAAGYPAIQTSFVGAAIERSMAEEIYRQLENGTLSNAANLTNLNQLTEYCNWLIDL